MTQGHRTGGIRFKSQLWFSGFVIQDRLREISLPQIPYPYNEENDIAYIIGLLWGLNEKNACKIPSIRIVCSKP